MTTFVDNSNTSCGNTAVTDAKLVHEVEKHPALYNPKRRGYKDSATMDRSWLLIANELGMKRKSLSLLPKYSGGGHQQIIVYDPNSMHLRSSQPNSLRCILMQCPSSSWSSKWALSYPNSLCLASSPLSHNLNITMSPVLITKFLIYRGLQS